MNVKLVWGESGWNVYIMRRHRLFSILYNRSYKEAFFFKKYEKYLDERFVSNIKRNL